MRDFIFADSGIGFIIYGNIREQYRKEYNADPEYVEDIYSFLAQDGIKNERFGRFGLRVSDEDAIILVLKYGGE